ncbi:MAG: addiction module protein [Bdellovibrio bacteriovorus]
MAVSLEKLEEQAQQLMPQERAALAERLLESLHSALTDVEAAWAQEIEERVAALDRGDTAVHAAEDVFAEARRLSR